VRRAYLSLGSNLGDRLEHLRVGATLVARADPWRASSVYETSPVGGVAQDNFYNLVIEISTDDSPRQLLERANEAEGARKRERTVRWGPRTLDVDVLLVGNERSDDPDIVVPHPRMWERRFVLEPLAELAPDLVSAAALASALGSVRRLGTLQSLG
jgi:2-amino-4-hydroxy-6-hydroxymethyldihydropteridine diphosphokinase